MVDPGAVFSLAQKAFDRYRILCQAGAQNLDCGDAALGVVCPVDGGSPTLADVLREAVSRDRPAG
jgi:hypothetical protein